MIREVDLVSYLPPFMQNYKELVAALEAENPEFILIWKAADQVLYNHFISTADEYGIGRYEKMLDIHPTSEDTLESRRSRVQSKWFNAVPYTMNVLLQKLTILCGNTDFILTHNLDVGYTIELITDLELFGQVEELEYIINTMFPENIAVISKNSIPCNVQGAVLFGGGMCFVNSFIITNDFREVYEIHSHTTHGGGVVHTDMVQVTDGFNEIIRANADANIGSGVVQVDFVEIN